MKTIGILGGMGSYATVELFRRIVDAFPAEKEWDRPRIIIDNNCVMPSRVRAILYNERREQLISDMSASIQKLVESGASQIVVGCITAHCFLDKLPYQELIINAVEETAKCITEQQVAILCTEGTRDVGIWNKVLPHCEIVYPTEQEMLTLREFIETVKQGRVTGQAKKEFAEYINSFSRKSMLLGCTELPILYEKSLCSKNVIDPIECVIKKIKEPVKSNSFEYKLFCR